MNDAQGMAMFLIYFRAELKMPSVSASSVIAAIKNVRTAPCCYFTLHKKTLKKVEYFRTSRIYYQRSFKGPTLCVNATQQVGASAMFNY
jgi:hypothetical protein